MTNDVVRDILAAEQEAGELIAAAHAAAREAVVQSQKNTMLQTEEMITQAKSRAKERLARKKKELDAQAGLLKKKELEYREFLDRAAANIDHAADLIAERILG